jgi:hypothetical protein
VNRNAEMFRAFAHLGDETAAMNQSMPPPTEPHQARRADHLTIHLCVPDDQARYLPRRRRAPLVLPTTAPLPRQGEVIYLSPQSAWGVTMVIHEWHAQDTLRIEIWLEHVTSERRSRPSGFVLTQ